jgi:DNA repair protein RadC
MERRPNQTEQLSFLPPGDAELVHLMRRFVAEASRIYETRTGIDAREAPQIKTPQDAYNFLRPEMAHLEQEQLRVLNLNVHHRVLSAPMLYQGTVGSTTVRVAEIFRPAIMVNASGIIVAHNHPSGEVDPSAHDVRLTEELVQAGRILDLEVLDHIIVGRDAFTSLRERGIGFGGAV